LSGKTASPFIGWLAFIAFTALFMLCAVDLVPKGFA